MTTMRIGQNATATDMYLFKRSAGKSSFFYLDRIFDVLEDALDHARYWNRTFKDAVLVTHYGETLLFLPAQKE